MIKLNYCEICGNKLSEEEKEKYSTECKECVDHLVDLLRRALKNK